MTPATAAISPTAPELHIEKTYGDAPCLVTLGADRIAMRAGTTLTIGGESIAFTADSPVEIDTALVSGSAYGVMIDGSGNPVAVAIGSAALPQSPIFAGFHFAPGGNAPGGEKSRAGGDDVPAINPNSCWDIAFRPACPDPRGMTLVAMPDAARFWADIYLLGVNHLEDGTSCFGAKIADGADRPLSCSGKDKYPKLDHATAVEIYAHHGKQLLSYDEFRVAAFGVTEKTSARKEPRLTGLDAARTSRFGLMQATGNMWQWGHDGDADSQRASIFGGSWLNGDYSGSRYAARAYWPGDSGGDISARGRCDHLKPA